MSPIPRERGVNARFVKSRRAQLPPVLLQLIRMLCAVRLFIEFFYDRSAYVQMQFVEISKIDGVEQAFHADFYVSSNTPRQMEQEQMLARTARELGQKQIFIASAHVSFFLLAPAGFRC